LRCAYENSQSQGPSIFTVYPVKPSYFCRI
jgi:hypothetical protein